MHLFPLSGQSGSRGVSIKVTLILQYRIYDKINQSILFFINETNLERKNKKMPKTLKRTGIPWGGGEWARKSLFGNIFYYQRLQYRKNDMIPIFSYI